MQVGFRKFSFFSLIFTLGVILWGAWVRFSHSGDGCGNSWPLCKGQITPDSFTALTEWIHRITSGLSLLIVFGLMFASFRIYPKKHITRKLAFIAAVFIFIEALIGAVLVLASLTGTDSSLFRVITLSFHLINSLALVAVLTLCWKSALSEKMIIQKPHIYFVGAFLLLALTGSIASLAGTLFPSASLFEAFLLDFLPESHITLKLRPLHPLFAIAFFLFLTAFLKGKKEIFLCALIAVFSGVATLFLLSPIYMKLSHLFIAYVFWIVLVSSAFQFSFVEVKENP